ncbi:DUF4271 domain-containing protein [Flavihumibacter rivuli]|uniref:DUF4271 domain-containing protein n=1 Tax=Flavihumibacter rivuli TaxID=2838156 RepID=UPI001BDE5678|nr:DUF4271 domain-containing protein [Flavihumibacter rivuli]ULQ56310.1 DUF4271 domain-containing protein [Flavihumibacter rivuli]
MKKYFTLLLTLCCTAFLALHAQVTDTLKRSDSLNVPRLDTARVVAATADSLSVTARDTAAAPMAAIAKTRIDYRGSTYEKVLGQNPYFNFDGKPVIRTMVEKRVNDKDSLFYLLAGLLLLLALVKALFGKYFSNLFAVFFRASLKQKQMREQLLQNPLPSLLLNICFIATGGLLAALVIHAEWDSANVPGFWWLYLYCLAGLSLVYLGKFFVLKMLGWTLRISATTDTYIFIVFLCNKVLAIFLLPLLMVAVFSSQNLSTVAMTISYALVAGIFAYRYISSYGYIRREFRTSRFHFFLYLCAFEVAPLLLIYKVLLKFV